MARCGHLAHGLKALLLTFLAMLSYSQAEPMETSNLAAYPKASEDATMVYRLQSNLERTHFFIDGKEMGIGRKLTVRVNNQGHTIVVRPEGCAKFKEEFVQPPYSLEAPLSFTFVTGECEGQTRAANINDSEVPESRAQPQLTFGNNTGTINIITGGNSGTTNQVGHRTQNTITPSQRAEMPARGKTPDKISIALGEIKEFVKSICPGTKNKGGTESLDVSGKASSKLTGLLNKLADLGIEGAAAYQKKDYEGVLQQDLAGLLSKDIDCRTDITKMLIEKLIK